MSYEYYINLDERGEFYSDVRNEAGDTILEFKDPEEFADDGFGDLREVSDVAEFMVFLGIIESKYDLVMGN